MMHQNRPTHYKVMKNLAILLLLISYLPMFYFKAYLYHSFGMTNEEISILPMYGILNNIFGIFSAIGISILLLSDYLKEKDMRIVPLAVLFFVLGLIFSLNTLFDSFYQTYSSVLIILISTILCYAFYLFIWRKYKWRT